jgi:hypothetical protein
MGDERNVPSTYGFEYSPPKVLRDVTLNTEAQAAQRRQQKRFLMSQGTILWNKDHGDERSNI